MKILAIGDPHGDLKSIKKISLKGVDLILLTGDLGSASLMRNQAFENIERRKKGLPEKIYSSRDKKRAFMEAYTTSVNVVRYLSKYAPVFTIYGNVESTNAETREYSKSIGLPLPFLTKTLEKIRNVKIINDKKIKFDGVNIGGLSYFVDDVWVKSFKPSEFKKSLSRANKQTSKAKKVLKRFGEVDILVCHQPPLGFLDKVTAPFAPKHWKGKNAGSKVILDYIKRKHPKFVFCGHIHEGQGSAKIGKTLVCNLGVAGYRVITI